MSGKPSKKYLLKLKGIDPDLPPLPFKPEDTVLVGNQQFTLRGSDDPQELRADTQLWEVRGPGIVSYCLLWSRKLQKFGVTFNAYVPAAERPELFVFDTFEAALVKLRS